MNAAEKNVIKNRLESNDKIFDELFCLNIKFFDNSMLSLPRLTCGIYSLSFMAYVPKTCSDLTSFWLF